MKKLLLAVAFSVVSTLSMAAGGGVALDKAPNYMNDLEALQSGARLFTNYCLNCHSAQAVRFSHLRDIGLSDEEIQKYLLFTTDKVGDLMKVSMRPADAKVWFGKAPPDLSLITRSRSGPGVNGADYVYTYLRSYYRDRSTPTGWNNTVFPNVGMPHPLWGRQGERELTLESIHQVGGVWEKVITMYDKDGFSSVTKETLGADYQGGAHTAAPKFNALNPELAAQFDTEAAQLTGFLSYISDPGAARRLLIGKIVMIYLIGFALIAWRLNASFWKEVK